MRKSKGAPGAKGLSGSKGPPGRRREREKKAPVKKVMTEDDYLEAADEYERGASKWRSGDAEKSARFIQRAFDAYQEGLQAFPSSFDLAYNKAVLEYEYARNDSHFGSKINFLRAALESHRYALRLNEENPDVLFNTAQLLTEIAEELDESDRSDRLERQDKRTQERISLLQEAIELFSSCLSRQEMLFSDIQAQQAAPAEGNEPGHQSTAGPSTEPPARSEEEEVWAIVEEPITAETLVDTGVAMIDALAALAKTCASLDEAETSLHPGCSAAAIESIARPLIEQKLPAYIELVPEISAERQAPPHPAPPTLVLSASGSVAAPSARLPPQTILAGKRAVAETSSISVARFRTAVACSEFNHGLIDSATLVQNSSNAFLPVASNGQTDALDQWGMFQVMFSPDATLETLDAYADALDTVNLHLFGDFRAARSDFSSEDLKAHRLLGLSASKLSLRCINEVIEGLKSRSRPVLNPTEDEAGYTVSLYARGGDVALQARTLALYLAEEDPASFAESQRDPPFVQQAQEAFTIAVASYGEAERRLDGLGAAAEDTAKMRNDVKTMNALVQNLRGDGFGSIDLSAMEYPPDVERIWADDLVLEMVGKGVIPAIEVGHHA